MRAAGRASVGGGLPRIKAKATPTRDAATARTATILSHMPFCPEGEYASIRGRARAAQEVDAQQGPKVTDEKSESAAVTFDTGRASVLAELCIVGRRATFWGAEP